VADLTRSLVRGATLAGLVLAANASAFVLLGDDWTYQADPITENFELDVASFPATVGTDAEIEDAYISALDRWSTEAEADMVYIYGGTTLNNSWANDGDNIGQSANQISGTTLAIAQYWLAAGDNIQDCDIEFYEENDLGVIDWTADPAGAGVNELDFEYVAVHELGHCIGLGHSGDSDAIMFAFASFGTDAADRELDQDDKDGAQAIYGFKPLPSELEVTGFAATDVGDGDGLFERGESVEITWFVDNLATADATNVVTTTTAEDSDVTVLVSVGTPSLGPDIAALSSDDVIGTIVDVDFDCVTDHDETLSVEVSSDQGSATFTFELPVTCDVPLVLTSGNWVAGQSVTTTTTGAVAFENVRFILSTGGEGNGPCPAPLGGLCLDVLKPMPKVTAIIADANGVANWVFTVPATIPVGTTMWLQAIVDRDADSRKSNVQAVTTQ
jgi:hypothetical protein